LEQRTDAAIAYTRFVFSENNTTQSAMLGSLNDEGDPVQRLERMKCEFLVAQQRRRASAPEIATPPDVTDHGPGVAGPEGGKPTGIAPVADLERALTKNS
jgi:hypothetical protein